MLLEICKTWYFTYFLCEQINSLNKDILNLTPGVWCVSSGKCERSIFKTDSSSKQTPDPEFHPPFSFVPSQENEKP